MLQSLTQKLRERRYGDPIVVVSGLPRSGTSMMMRMLVGGGLEAFTDEERVADVDNPKGYFEFERVKNLEKDPDRSWVKGARGQTLKVISFLLPFLPDDNRYRIIFLRRHLDEILASQTKMLDRLGTQDDAEAEMMREAFRNQIAAARIHVRKQPNMDILEINYADTVGNPTSTAQKVNAFLGGILDEQGMAEAVDPSLYRNRA